MIARLAQNQIMMTQYTSVLDDPNRRLVGYWLLFVAGLVVLMVLVGGATRLTGSGLSMTDWKPISGVIPPISDTEWVAEFDNYKKSPEYLKVNAGMSLEAFKAIFYWEWGHRVLGRVIGLAFGLPLLFFWLSRRVPQGYHLRLLGLFVLGGMQGLLGWYMVKSGLVDRPSVSHYRLAAHLSLALFLLFSLLWTGLSLLRPTGAGASLNTRRLALFALSLLVIQLVLGALVAGLDAGHAAQDWPLMQGQIIPAGLGLLEPWWLNLIENPLTLQFEHRLVAYVLTGVIIAIYFSSREASYAIRLRAVALCIVTVLQVTLGIITVVLAVPVWAGVAHQAGGVALLIALTALLHESRNT